MHHRKLFPRPLCQTLQHDRSSPHHLPNEPEECLRTSYTGILTMSAVFMVTPTTVSTTGNWRLISKAIQRIYPYWTGSLAMTGAAKDLGNPVEAKLLACHQASVDVPPTVTNCAPLIIKIDLYPSSEWIITSYTQCTICQNFERKEDSISTDLWFDWNVHQLFNARSIKKKSL